MGYKSVGVALAPGMSNGSCLTVTAELAERFDARVIGMMASMLRPPFYYTDGMYGAEILKREEVELQKGLANAEEEFHQALKGRIKHTEWRTSLRKIARDFIPSQARSVDVIVTAAQQGSESDPYTSARAAMQMADMKVWAQRS